MRRGELYGGALLVRAARPKRPSLASEQRYQWPSS